MTLKVIGAPGTALCWMRVIRCTEFSSSL